MRAPARAALIASLAAFASACGAGRGASLLPAPEVVFRGHQEVEPASGRPRVIGRSAPVGLCVDVPPETDTSQWEARLFDRVYVAPAARLDAVLCFEAPVPESLRDGETRLCAELRDRFDGTSQPLPCVTFVFESDDAALRDLERRIPGALASGGLDALAAEADARGFPALSFRVRLVAAYALRRQGSDASRAEAARHLSGEPRWIGGDGAERWRAQLSYERAALALDAHADLAGSWQLLRAAEEDFRRCGDRKWIAVVGKQAEVLARVGATAEAKQRIRSGLEACATAPCDPALAAAAENTLAWLAATDPDAGEAELDAAERSLAARAPADALENANVLLNLAFVRARRGSDPAPAIGRARELLASAPRSGRARELSGWSSVAEGRSALASGDAARATGVCDGVAGAEVGDRLRAYALGCAAAARRSAGDLRGSAERWARALELHARSSARQLGQDVPLGPGQRAEDTYAAARVEIELDRAGAAWALLAGLDHEGSIEGGDGRDDTLEPWLATLAALEEPASEARRAQREAIRRGALDRIQESLRRSRGAGDPAAGDDEPSFRLVPLDDEVVVLRRAADGVVPYRRTPFRRGALVELVGEVADAIERGEADDARWRRLVAPLAEALAPRPEDLGPLTTFAAHGILQEVPLAALPAGDRWLGELTAVAWRPAGAGGRRAAAPPSGAPVFVSDPRGDLGLPADPGYGTASGSRVLRGGEATRAAVSAALAGASVLHVDAHARYEPAFPELSTIVLADGPLAGAELARWAPGLRLANLSGCQTGRSPVSADSGRFGMGGLLARAGAEWVVATRATLDNALGVDFNRAFYAGLARGEDVGTAYRGALAGVARRHPASKWAALVLLGGQSGGVRTPSPSRASE